MTKKDYIDLAAAVRTARQVYMPSTKPDAEIVAFHDGKNQAIAAITAELCRRLHADNPRFDRERFLSAIEGK